MKVKSLEAVDELKVHSVEAAADVGETEIADEVGRRRDRV